MLSFFISAGLVFLFEMGDKTQLVALCLATKFSAKTVLWGIFWATLIIHLFSALIGHSITQFVPQEYIKIIAGLAFIVFGFWTIKGDKLNDEVEACSNKKLKMSPFMIVTVTFFLAELGDKTMLSTITIATQYNWIGVWLGSTVGMVIADAIAVAIGLLMGKNLPEKAVKIGAAVIFFAFGVIYLLSGLSKILHFDFINL